MAKKRRENYRENFASLSIKIPWKYFKDILIKDFGFEIVNKSGSVRVFVREEVRFTVHEPHGRGHDFVSKIDRQKAIQALEALGLLE
ncbi:MAG: hypothetical protein J7L08_03455 [Candidatus Aenigmarchaeota archaeon]|nr:hypothetical protein [Candidatus Aenigmarchaeota archaeon]